MEDADIKRRELFLNLLNQNKQLLIDAGYNADSIIKSVEKNDEYIPSLTESVEQACFILGALSMFGRLKSSAKLNPNIKVIKSSLDNEFIRGFDFEYGGEKYRIADHITKPKDQNVIFITFGQAMGEENNYATISAQRKFAKQYDFLGKLVFEYGQFDKEEFGDK